LKSINSGQFGERTNRAQPPSSKRVEHSVERTLNFNKTDIPIVIANSRLIVVQAFLLGCEIEALIRESGHVPQFIESEWSSKLVDDCEQGTVDFAIFNRTLVDRYLANTPKSTVERGNVVSHSMGGKNFSVIVREDHKLIGVEPSQMLEQLASSVIYVGLDTDRFTNLLLVLNSTVEQLRDAGIRLVNISDPSLSVLDSEPEALVVCGQNMRLQAHRRGGFQELLMYQELDTHTRKELHERSSNVSIMSNQGSASVGGVEDFTQKLIERFRMNTASDQFVANLAKQLSFNCDFEGASPADRLDISKQVLFETFRLGAPVL